MTSCVCRHAIGARMYSDTQALLRTLHKQGALLATVSGSRWYAIFATGDRFWLSSGTSEDDRRDILPCKTYDDALECFRAWWDDDFNGPPGGPRVVRFTKKPRR